MAVGISEVGMLVPTSKVAIKGLACKSYMEAGFSNLARRRFRGLMVRAAWLKD